MAAGEHRPLLSENESEFMAEDELVTISPSFRCSKIACMTVRPLSRNFSFALNQCGFTAMPCEWRVWVVSVGVPGRVWTFSTQLTNRCAFVACDQAKKEQAVQNTSTPMDEHR
jgi:hypothetical protein